MQKKYKIGYILLIKYKYCPIGWLIRKITHSNWNHVAWILNDKLVLEIRNGGIKITPIKRYNNKFFETKIIKLLKIKDEDIKYILLDEIIKKKIKSYKLPIFFTMLGVLLKIKNLRYTCSSYIASLLSKYGFYFIKDKNPLYITPEDINTSKNVKDVCLCKKEDRYTVYNKIKKVKQEYCFKCKEKLYEKKIK